ncbi:MAG: PhoX family phosphatase [Alphaproteobacteria bacterium]|nr:MAG: PhoX family phosphatase [Alphaproteobacteria bacterium]
MTERNYDGLTRAQAYELSQDVGVNPSTEPTIGDVINQRFGRREMLKGALGAAAITAVAAPLALAAGEAEAAGAPRAGFRFAEPEHGVDQTHHVAPGYTVDVVLRWGDPLFADAPEFDPTRQSAAAQRRQFGYNCDYVGYAPLPEWGSRNADRGLLCINHEYTSEEVMFAGVGRQGERAGFGKMTKDLVDIEMAAHGCSVVEIQRGRDGKYTYVRNSRYNRRLTTGDTVMAISGPAAGHPRMRTTADPTGTRVIGTVNNCAGGMTPWGTYLTAEENFHGYSSNRVPEGHPEFRNQRRYGVGERWYNWADYYDRWDATKEPMESNRFGWIVEIDPYDPTSMPVKRTALGRKKNEGAESIVNRDGRVVVYMGDDERFEYVYKFVSRNRINRTDRRANRSLLDDGTLFVAKYNDDGTGVWMPLVFGTGPLTAANGFNSQADVMIEARRAADLLGATPMDRPEDVEPNATTGRVYVALTNNDRRRPDQLNGPNSRPANEWGQVLEMINTNDDHAATTFRWEILIRCGNPTIAAVGAMYNPATSANGWMACPDNMAIDGQGRLWVGTDQGGSWSRASGRADGVYAVETHGTGRGTSKLFFRTPIGAEICGMHFLPGDRAMTIAVQHPGVDGTGDFRPFARESTFEDPATRWPDFQPNMPPRPSVVMVRKTDGGVIGS